MNSVVYFVGFDRYVKIGYSSNFARRFETLQEYLPAVLSIYVLLQGADMKYERELHRLFCEWRCRGEWFRFGHPIMTWIEEARGAPFLPNERSALLWCDDATPASVIDIATARKKRESKLIWGPSMANEWDLAGHRQRRAGPNEWDGAV